MSVLAIDTSSRLAATVLRATRGGHILAAREVAGGHLDEELPPVVAELLRGAVDPVTAVVVLTGPGSYTGVRAGMAAALGIAVARSLPLHGLGTLTAIGAAATVVSDGIVAAITDAGRGAYFAAPVRRGRGRAVAEAGEPERRMLDELRTLPWPLVSSVALAGLEHQLVAPSRALAAAIPHALAAAPLTAAGLTARHVAAAPPG